MFNYYLVIYNERPGIMYSIKIFHLLNNRTDEHGNGAAQHAGQHTKTTWRPKTTWLPLLQLPPPRHIPLQVKLPKTFLIFRANNMTKLINYNFLIFRKFSIKTLPSTLKLYLASA